MTLLVNLPFSISGEFLGVWFDLKTLVNLDSAFCNREFRPVMLALFASPYCTYSNKFDHWSGGSVKWLLKRQLKLENLLILPKVEHQHIIAYLQVFGNSVRGVSCEAFVKDQTLDILIFYTHELTYFRFYDFYVNEKLSEVVRFNSQLRELRLEEIRNLQVGHLTAIHLPHLRRLSLYFSVISDALLIAIVRTSTHLTHIDLEECTGITDAGLITLSQHCVGFACLSVSDQTLCDIVRLCPHIAHLNITANNVVTDAGILSIAQGLRYLQGLACSGCVLLTDLALLHLTTYCAQTLEFVSIGGSRQVRVSVLTSFLQQCTKLNTLSTDLQLHMYCRTVVPHMYNLTALLLWSVVTDDMLMLIAQHCKLLQLFEIADSTAVASQAHGNSDDTENMLYTTTASISTVPTYTGKGLFSLVHGLPHLRVLGVDKKHFADRCFVELAQYMWQTFRPGLVITSSVQPLVYDVMNQ